MSKTCEFCAKVLKNTSSLNKHQSTTIACIKLREEKEKNDINKFKCDKCLKSYTTKQSLDKHVCKEKTTNLHYEIFFHYNINISVIASLEGYFLSVNKMFSDLLGYTFEELCDNTLMSFVHHDDVKKTMEELEKAKKNIPSLLFVNRYRTKDGNYKKISWNAMTIDDKIYSTGIDITNKTDTENLTDYLTHYLTNHVSKQLTDNLQQCLRENLSCYC